MKRVVGVGVWGVGTAALLFTVWACGSSSRSGFDETPPPLVGGDDADIGDAVGFAEAAPPDDDDFCAGPRCSSDLHNVIDCDNNVITACPPDQGCSGTSCVPACDSAAANKNSLGCEYYVVEPTFLFSGLSPCYAAFVANTWSTPVKLTVEYGGQALAPSTFAYIPSGTGTATTYTPITNDEIPAGQVAILFLNRLSTAPSFPGLDVSCPAGVTAAITDKDASTYGTGMGNSFHITTTAPVAAYDMYPYGGGQSAMTSASLLLPVTAWDTNYIAVDAWQQGPGDQPAVAIVAKEDATSVTIKPTNAIVGGNGVAAGAKGVPTTYTLSKGQVVQFVQDAALAGSVIQSTAPVGVFGGKSGLGIDGCCEDTGHQQIPPVRALGNVYLGVRYRNRYDGVEESPPWRIIGAAAGTTLTWDPAIPPGAPTQVELGQVVTFYSNGPWVVKSQDADHPFYMSAHMTGAEKFDTTGKDGRGDAEFVNMIPAGEHLASYVFFTDPTYPETDLVLVRKRRNGAFADVTLDCAGVLGGWQPIDSAGKYEYTRFDLIRHNFQPQGNCNNGRHEIHSTDPFGLTVWGWGSGETGQVGAGFYSQYVSYAYPAGAGVAPINTVVVSPVK